VAESGSIYGLVQEIVMLLRRQAEEHPDQASMTFTEWLALIQEEVGEAQKLSNKLRWIDDHNDNYHTFIADMRDELLDAAALIVSLLYFFDDATTIYMRDVITPRDAIRDAEEEVRQ
jgi:hypothetical protein